jgi:Potential Monad-binding region of RPAP3
MTLAPARTMTSTAASRAPPTAPRTLFEFKRAWDNIPASETGARWALLNVCRLPGTITPLSTDFIERAPFLTYFQTIPPTSLPALFGASLEPTLLASFIPVFAAVASPADIRICMCALTGVPRFKTVAQFLSKAERDAARAVWETVIRSTDAAGADDAEVAEATLAWGFTNP